MKILILILFITILGKAPPGDEDLCDRFNGALLGGLVGVKPEDAHLANIAQFIRYSGTNINDLGDYNSCIALPDAEYFRIDFNFTKADLPSNVQIGICYHKDCDPIYLETNLRLIRKAIEEKTGLGLKGGSITRPAYDDHKRKRKQSNWRYIVFLTLILVVVVNLFCCILVQYFESVNPYVRAFDPILNFRSLIKFRASALNGFRFVAMWGVVYGHVFYFMLYYGTIRNITELKDIISSWRGTILICCYYAVDVFFFISGFLFRINVKRSIPEKANKAVLFVKGIVVRYLRLVPLLIVLVFGTKYVVRLIEFGPNQEKTGNLGANCGKEWYKILFFINNFKEAYDCVGHTWYLANDMQFFIFSFLVVLIFKSKVMQDLIFSTILIGSAVYSFIFAYNKGYGYNEILNYRKIDDDYFYDFYIMPLPRIGPYLLGMMFANYFTALEEDKNPSESKSIYAKVNGWLRKSNVLYYLYYLTAIVCFGLAVYMNHVPNNSEERLDRLTASIFNASSKMLITFALGAFYHLSFIGRIDWVDFCFSWTGYDFFTKLGYSIYLFHYPLCAIINENLESSFYVTFIDFFCYAVSVFVGITGFSLVMTLLFDSPVAKLVRIATTKK